MKKKDNSNLEINIKSFLEKVKAKQGNSKYDLSSDEDLSLAVMNLVGIEEHTFFTTMKTGKAGYLPVVKEAREMRKKLMTKLLKNPQGEEWCLSKHLLSASMRLMEVGTKSLGQGKDKEANDFFQMSYQLYSLFWGINLGVVKGKSLKNDPSKFGFEKDEFIASETIASRKGVGIFARLGELVKKAIDCCIE